MPFANLPNILETEDVPTTVQAVVLGSEETFQRTPLQRFDDRFKAGHGFDCRDYVRVWSVAVNKGIEVVG